MKPDRTRMVTHDVEAEPQVGGGGIPVIFFAILAGLIFVGALYLDKYGGGFSNEVFSPYESYDQVAKAQPADPITKSRLNGENVYMNKVQCKLCHQPNGLGTPGTFPPLDGSEWVNGPVARLIRIPHNGLNGPIKVKGEQWNAAMPPFGPLLTDEDMADVLTYIRSSWSNKSSPVTVDEVKKVRADIGSRTDPWTEAELLQVQ
jgi:mono/diheme cytochrome c family protein